MQSVLRLGVIDYI